ncbi:MAG TPA: PQQ-dependent sugar dehydrogenase [Polyangia bacterium]|nr:PQQ-dependent sugar dehydrogenase [Polyangia bacterium]
MLAVASARVVAGAAAEELPLDRLKLPAGFRIAVYAHPVKNARSLALGPDGIVFVGTRSAGNVYALVPDSERQHAQRVVTLARGLENPNGVAYRDGALYVAERSRILRYDDIAHHLDAPPKPTVVRDDYPHKAHHGWKFIAFGPDGWLYVPVGAPCNECKPPEPIFATITRLSIDGNGGGGGDGKQREIFARGVRNTVGFDWDPRTRELWFTDNGRDDLGDDRPPDELDHAPRAGMDFGFPYCHGRDIADPKYGREHACSELTPPVAELGAHVAALGMRFYTGTMFPDEYRGDIFIAEHGSWNRTIPVGYRVVRVKLDGNRVVRNEVFAEGWLPPNPKPEDPHRPNSLRADETASVVQKLSGAKRSQAWGRPVDVLVMPDGALLVSDDSADAVYRITYERR